MSREHPLKRWRLAQNPPVGLKELADQVGTNRSYLWKIEMGDRQPSLDLLRALVAATGAEVTADEIVWWTAKQNSRSAACAR